MLENHEKSICAMQETTLDIQDIRILVLVLASRLVGLQLFKTDRKKNGQNLQI